MCASICFASHVLRQTCYDTAITVLTQTYNQLSKITELQRHGHFIRDNYNTVRSNDQIEDTVMP